MRRFLWKASHCSRVRVPLLLAVGAGLLAAPTAGAGGQAGFGCAPGFELGANTVAQALLLPRIQAGLASGFGQLRGRQLLGDDRIASPCSGLLDTR